MHESFTESGSALTKLEYDSENRFNVHSLNSANNVIDLLRVAEN